MKKMDKTRRNGILKLTLFALIMLLLTVLCGKPIIRAVKDPAAFRNWVEGYGIWGKIAFFFMMYVQTVIAFIPGEPLEIAAGYAFGAIPGLIIGNEAKGVSKEVQGISNVRLKIPMRGGAESLNAAVAAGILMYELTK